MATSSTELIQTLTASVTDSGRRSPAHLWEFLSSAHTEMDSTDSWSQLVRTSRNNRRCIITLEDRPAIAIEVAHLIPISTRSDVIRKLHYAFGRKLDLNSRWFTIFLRADIHKAFEDETNPGWILLPPTGVLRAISDKIRTLKSQRKAAGRIGPWPDFRSHDWYPSRRSGYEYRFVPLAMMNDPYVINRREAQQSPPAHVAYWYPYINFPALRLHVHPYAVIFNAGLKLQNMMPKDYPASLSAEDAIEVLFIYNSLIGASREDRSHEEHHRNNTPSRGSLASARSDETANRRSKRLRTDEMQHDNPTSVLLPAGSTNQSGSVENLSNASNQHDASYSEECYSNPQDALSISVCPSAYNMETESTRSTALIEDSNIGPERLSVSHWIDKVETARQRGELVDTEKVPIVVPWEDEESPRQIDSKNWCNWTSEFAPWWMIVPELEQRGILSSNDWVAIKINRSLVHS